MGIQTKKRIGIVLSSGSARGLAHIGVLRTLDKEGIKIDCIAGSSMGALVGSAYAAGVSMDKLEEVALTLEWKEKIDFTVPKTGLIAGRQIEEYIRELIGGKSFSKLKKKLFVVATRLDGGKEVVFSSGDVARAVHASIAIPAIFSPVKIGKYEYIDGGVINPIPIDVLKGKADVIIAVDLSIKPQDIYSRDKENRTIGEFINEMVGRFVDTQIKFIKESFRVSNILHIPSFIRKLIYWILDKILNPLKIVRLILGRPMPRIVSIIMESQDIMSNQLAIEKLKANKPDVVIKPKLYSIRWEDFDKAKEIIKAGEDATKKALPTIRKLCHSK